MRSERRGTFEAAKAQIANQLFELLSDPSLNASDIERVQIKAALSLLNIDIAVLPLNPRAEDFEDLRDSIIDIANAIDPLFYEIGQEARCNSHTIKSADVEADFKRPVFTAIDGFATYHLENEADELREAAAEYASDPRGWERARMEGVD
jgi:hypothetical protein